MQKIVPHLWFDKEAKEAAEFYVSAFGDDSRIDSSRVIHDTPSGDAEAVNFTLKGYSFAAISAGPYFKVNPSVSFMLNFDPLMFGGSEEQARAALDALWAKLSEGGAVLMPLQEYPFSKHYGWVADKYGVSWQLILTSPEREPRPFIVPSLLFTKEGAGKAEAATTFYLSVFKDAKQGMVARYPAGMDPEKEGTLMFSEFTLEGQWFIAMDSANPGHTFMFNEAVSLMIMCEDQAEIDYYWNKLSAVPESEQCGWLKDQFGISWQVVPRVMNDMMAKGTPEQIERVTKAFLQMKKFDIAALERAYQGA